MVLRYDDSGSGDAVVLVPGGLTGWLSWIPTRGAGRREQGAALEFATQ